MNNYRMRLSLKIDSECNKPKVLQTDAHVLFPLFNIVQNRFSLGMFKHV